MDDKFPVMSKEKITS